MNKEELREYFLTRKSDFKDFDNLNNRLNNISIFDSENQLNMKLFFNNIMKIISWELINTIPILIEKDQEHEKINFVINVQAWAFKVWDTSIENANINKIVTAYTIINRLYLNTDKDLNWNFKSQKMDDYLSKLLPSINFDVQLDSLPDNISYEDRKFHEVYKKALNKKDYKNIIDFLTNNGFIISVQKNPMYYFLEIITKLSIIYPTLLLDNFVKYSPVLINTILKYLDKEQLLSLLENYNDNDPLPLLLGLINIVNPNGNNMYNENIEKDIIFLKRASILIKKISNIIIEENLFKFISNCSNISMNKLWHGIFMIFIEENNKYSQGYIDSIDFSNNTERLGEYSYFIYSENCKDDEEFSSFSIKVYEKYLLELSKDNHGHYFKFSSYYQYFFHAIKILSNNSFEKYLLLLENISLSLRRAIYSWNHNELYKYFTDWFYWIISAKFFTRNNSIEKEKMTNTYNLLTDERLFGILNYQCNKKNIFFNNLKDFLDNPDIIQSISLTDNYDVVDIIWKK